jgi:hypothetical protein
VFELNLEILKFIVNIEFLSIEIIRMCVCACVCVCVSVNILFLHMFYLTPALTVISTPYLYIQPDLGFTTK